jgi:hypothetical protein
MPLFRVGTGRDRTPTAVHEGEVLMGAAAPEGVADRIFTHWLGWRKAEYANTDGHFRLRWEALSNMGGGEMSNGVVATFALGSYQCPHHPLRAFCSAASNGTCTKGFTGVRRDGICFKRRKHSSSAALTARNPDPVCADCGRDLPADGYCGCAAHAPDCAIAINGRHECSCGKTNARLDRQEEAI